MNPCERPSLPGHMRKLNPEGVFGSKKTGSWSSRGSWSSNKSWLLRGLNISVVQEERHRTLEATLGRYQVF